LIAVSAKDAGDQVTALLGADMMRSRPPKVLFRLSADCGALVIAAT
jgi:hypothetical protein